MTSDGHEVRNRAVCGGQGEWGRGSHIVKFEKVVGAKRTNDAHGCCFFFFFVCCVRMRRA